MAEGPSGYSDGSALHAVTFGVSLPMSMAAVAAEWGLTMWLWTRLFAPKASNP